MRSYYKNIYTVLKVNRFIVWAVVICTALSSMFSIYTVVSMNKKVLNSAFAVSSKGEIIPLELVTQKENFKIEALAHLRLFHQYFYDLNASNYKDNLEKALWLGDSSIDDLYMQKKANGVYNRLLQYSLVQKVISIDSKIAQEEEHYTFTSRILFEINRGSTIDTYKLVVEGGLIKIDRNFPHNPHGLLITDYYEKQLEKIETP